MAPTGFVRRASGSFSFQVLFGMALVPTLVLHREGLLDLDAYNGGADAQAPRAMAVAKAANSRGRRDRRFTSASVRNG